MPEDTSSPRTTYVGFMQVMGEHYDKALGPHGHITNYLSSNRLYPAPGEFDHDQEVIQRLRERSSKYLDLSDLPEVLLHQNAWRLTIQLKEVLDRLPPLNPESIPDQTQMLQSGKVSWAVPGTEIRIVRIDSGPHTGEYLFSKETVHNVPNFFEAVRHLPYQPGASVGNYDFKFHFPSGVALALRHVVPPRWFLNAPEWSQRVILDQPIWRWIGIILMLGVWVGILYLSIKSLSLIKREDLGSVCWISLLPPFVVLSGAPLILYIFDEVLRVSFNVFVPLSILFWALFYFALAIFCWMLGGLLAESIVRVERIRQSSIDGQLIRLSVRFVTAFLVIAILMQGANRLGIPVYSVMAGLGIGGLAAALAGQQTLANLFGSLIIMFEKPFRIGHTIRAGSIEGKVLDVGFRSTRLMTVDSTITSVPSSEIANRTIENLTLRKNWRVKRSLFIHVETKVVLLSHFLEALRSLLEQQDAVIKDSIRVTLCDIGLNGFEIQMDFKVEATNEGQKRILCDQVLMATARLAGDLGLHFVQGTG